MAESQRPLILAAVGDVFLDRPEPEGVFDLVEDVFAGADVVFGNSEGVYAERWERAPSAGSPVVASPAHVKVLGQAGFDVMSLANNHIGDGGYTALLATRDALREAGIATTGVGENQTDAHRPAILDAAGHQVAVLGYSAVFPHGYEARPALPGLAPIRAHTLYTPWELNEWNPGLLPKVSTVALEADQSRFVADIESARRETDVVIVSVHWGDFTRPYVLTDHERRTAHAAIDAGADAVVGHHHHLLRGVEIYRDRPIFYGLGHFGFDLPNLEQRLAADGYLGGGDPAERRAAQRRFGDYRIWPREGYPLLPFHADGRLTGVAVMCFDPPQRPEVGFIPCVLGPDNRPRPVSLGSDEGDQVVDYLRRCVTEEDLPVVIEPTDALLGGRPGVVLSAQAPSGLS